MNKRICRMCKINITTRPETPFCIGCCEIHLTRLKDKARDKKERFGLSPTELYRQYDENGRLLYVGITIHLPTRLKEHRCQSPWFRQIKTITIEHYPTRSDALKAEKAAIVNEKPLLNVVHNSCDGEST